MQGTIKVTEKKNGEKVYAVSLDGQLVDTRTSKRVYKFAVVKMVMRDKVLAMVTQSLLEHYKQGSQERKNYDFHTSEASVREFAARFPSLYDEATIERELQEKRDYLKKYPTFDDYFSVLFRESIARVEASPETALEVLCYCGRADLAAKEMAKAPTSTGPVFLASV